MRNLILYLLCLALLCYAAIIYGSEALMLLSYTGISLAVLAYLVIVIQVFFIRVKVSLPIAMVERGGGTELVTDIINRGILPVPKIRLCFQRKDGLTGKKKRFWVNGAVAGRDGATIFWNLEGHHSGSFVYSLKKIRIYDMTGLFYFTKWDRQQAELTVMPQICEMNVRVTERARNFLGDAEIYDDKIAGPDASEVFAVRAFQNGDKIQNIHWKMSAKTDELMVRENSLPLGCPVVLLVDLIHRPMRKSVDELLTLAASISFALVEQKCPHYAVWYDRMERDVVRLRVDKEEDLYQFLLLLCKQAADGRVFQKQSKRAISRQQSKRAICSRVERKSGNTEKDVTAIRTMYHEKYRMEYAVMEITVNQKLEIWKDDALYQKFDRRSFPENAGNIELVV